MPIYIYAAEALTTVRMCLQRSFGSYMRYKVEKLRRQYASSRAVGDGSQDREIFKGMMSASAKRPTTELFFFPLSFFFSFFFPLQECRSSLTGSRAPLLRS